jgi:hypothetical protein
MEQYAIRAGSQLAWVMQRLFREAARELNNGMIDWSALYGPSNQLTTSICSNVAMGRWPTRVVFTSCGKEFPIHRSQPALAVWIEPAKLAAAILQW